MTLTEEQVQEFIGNREVFEYDLQTEMDVLRELDELLADADVFWDIGAHSAMYTLVAAQAHPNLDVYCFEASAITREEKLHPNIDDVDNATVVPYALADEPGTVLFQESGVGQTNNSLEETTVGPDEHEKIEIEAHSARSAVNDLNIPAPDVVKLDIEGAEYTALRGFDKELLDGISVVLAELHHINTVDESTVPYLEEHGFEVTTLANRATADDRRMEHIQAVKPDA
jgi:FkbM family methyltransferase